MTKKFNSVLFQKQNRLDLASLILRSGLGLVFVIGGWNKLYQLLDPTLVAKILASYYAPSGYINAFFHSYLFDTAPLSALITPWGFLTTLSAFELIAGILLISGLMVRPLALFFGLLLWSFVIALPVITVAGAAPDIVTYRSPAMLVQIRDIALSGMMFTLFNLGAGKFSIEQEVFGGPVISTSQNLEPLQLLLRLSLAGPLIVGGLFSGYDHIPTFNTPWWILFTLGLATALSIAPKFTGSLIAGVMVFYITTKVSFDASLISNLNGFKRELAFLAGGMIFALLGGGEKFSWRAIVNQSKSAPG